MSQTKSAGGMTAAELERIAIEAGIDPAAVRLAAEEVTRGEAERGIGERLLGGPSTLRYVFEVDGELTQEDHEALLAVVQRGLDVSGTLTVAGRTFSWHATGPNRSITVQVAPVRGKSVVRIEERLGNLIGGIYGGVGGGIGGSLVPLAGFAGATLFGPAGVVAAVVGSLAASYLGTRAIYGGITKRRKRALDALAADLRATLEEVLAARLPESRSAKSALDDARERQGLAPAPSPTAPSSTASGGDAAEREVDALRERVVREG